jgi:hypothetical protein
MIMKLKKSEARSQGGCRASEKNIHWRLISFQFVVQASPVCFCFHFRAPAISRLVGIFTSCVTGWYIQSLLKLFQSRFLQRTALRERGNSVDGFRRRALVLFAYACDSPHKTHAYRSLIGYINTFTYTFVYLNIRHIRKAVTWRVGLELIDICNLRWV